MLTIDRIDHIVLTVKSIESTCSWYQRVLNIPNETFGELKRTALVFGRNKINLHEVGKEFEPKALDPRSGDGDLCLIFPNTESSSHETQLAHD